MGKVIVESPSDQWLQEDLENNCRIMSSDDITDMLKNTTVLVTGATGLVGSQLVKTLACLNRKMDTKIRILAMVRNMEKAKKIYGKLLERGDLVLIQGDILCPIQVDEPIDYIFHGAAVTASKKMISEPVETLRTAVNGTENILQFAYTQKVRSMVYLSSMEVYGQMNSADPVTEEKLGYINPLSVRSDYPESKRLCENMCVAWYSEYGVPVRIARLAQTFGAGILPGENRVFAQFARSVIRNEDIVLHTEGRSEGNYCYTADTVRGLITILLKGDKAQAYNIVNEASHTTIRDMAEFAADVLAEGRIKVVYDIPADNRFGYAADTKLFLSSQKLRKLGWKPLYGLKESYERLIGSMKATGEE